MYSALEFELNELKLIDFLRFPMSNWTILAARNGAYAVMPIDLRDSHDFLRWYSRSSG